MASMALAKLPFADAVYEKISHQFECSVFLENVGEDFRKQGLIHGRCHACRSSIWMERL